MPAFAVADRARGALGGRLHRLSRVRRRARRGRLLDQLLVPALDRALALAERQHAAVGVGEHLDLDVARRDDRLLDVERAVAERGLRPRRAAVWNAASSSSGSSTRRMPLPPPPATAFSSTG